MKLHGTELDRIEMLGSACETTWNWQNFIVLYGTTWSLVEPQGTAWYCTKRLEQLTFPVDAVCTVLAGLALALVRLDLAVLALVAGLGTRTIRQWPKSTRDLSSGPCVSLARTLSSGPLITDNLKGNASADFSLVDMHVA